MAIISNTFTENTPYFSSHIPLALKADEQLVTLIDEMVSYSVIPAEIETVVNQPFGAENFYTFSILIRNVTKNVNLQIELLTGEQLFKSSENNFELAPSQTRDIIIGIDESKFNALGSEAQIVELLQLKISNLDNGTYAIKNLSLESLSQARLPTEINIE
jgi:hypothetical protein